MRLLKLRHDRPLIALGPDAAWFRMPDACSVHIPRRKHLRRLLVALANQRESAPGTVLPVTEMVQAGWPGDRSLPKAAATRVYTAVHTLRALGLGDTLIRRSGGYFLDADVQWATESQVPPPLPAEDELLAEVS